MLRRLGRIGTCLLLGLLAASPAGAQESPWKVELFADGGMLLPLRNLGKNSVEIQEQAPLQTVASMENSPVVGGGVVVHLPDGGLRIRAQIHSTVSGSARGILGLCESGELAAPGVGLCAVDISAGAQVIDGSAELIFLAGRPERTVRPLIWLGLGVRDFDFDSDLSECDIYLENSDEAAVCTQAREIFENPSTNPLLSLGLGVEADKDPVGAFVNLSVRSSFYSGGTENVDGGRQLDLFLTGGVSLRVR